MKTLKLDESFSETHATLGMISFWLDWDWISAEKDESRLINGGDHRERSFKKIERAYD